MAERVRICDIAEELGLSTATVSNVIHGKTGKVSAETAERVTALLEEREYIPSMAGILLARNSSRILGVFVNDHPKYEGHTLNDFFIASSLNFLSAEIERTGRCAARRARRREAARAQRRPPRRDGDRAARLAGGAKQHRAAQRIILHRRGAFILYSVMRLTFASLLPGIYKEEKREVRYERTKDKALSLKPYARSRSPRHCNRCCSRRSVWSIRS